MIKKVRRKDLICLIARHYREFLDPGHNPINDIVNGHGEILIDIDSIFITVRDYKRLGLFSKDDVKKTIMNDFAQNLEAITFGNLKVIRVRDDDDILIANSYEVID